VPASPSMKTLKEEDVEEDVMVQRLQLPSHLL
jgi:hypothetical protein